VFLRLYLNALDEELLALLASTTGYKSAAAAPGLEEREVSQSDQTDVGKRGLMVRQSLISLCVELGIAYGRVVMSSLSRSSRP
jgi:hypothetical protein